MHTTHVHGDDNTRYTIGLTTRLRRQIRRQGHRTSPLDSLATASHAARSKGLLRRSRLLHGSVGHDEALHLRLVAPALLVDGRLQHADHGAVEAEHKGEQRRYRDEAEDVLVCGAEGWGGAEAWGGGGARAAG